MTTTIPAPALTPATATSPSPLMPAPPSRPRLSQRHPWLYPVAVQAHRARRRVQWMLSDARWARTRAEGDLPVRVMKHGSLLLRQLEGAEMELQHNKVHNLRLAVKHVDGIVIRPGETFSFNKVVGNCTRLKGYVEGMRLSNGEARPGVGGGICQLANLIHWMVLHSPLTVVERSEHSFDPFPDSKRVLPWGVGCSIVYNYVDLAFRNDTAHTFQLLVHVGDKHLKGELRVDRPLEVSYKVEARGEEFVRTPTGDVYRRNEIWRTVIDKRTGDRIDEECVKRNCALVKYHPADDLIRDL